MGLGVSPELPTQQEESLECSGVGRRQEVTCAEAGSDVCTLCCRHHTSLFTVVVVVCVCVRGSQVPESHTCQQAYVARWVLKPGLSARLRTALLGKHPHCPPHKTQRAGEQTKQAARCLLDYRWPAKRLTRKRSRPRRWQRWEHYPPPPLPVYNGRAV
ncbi:unnamed protein product [Pleuronectes platessa]|uniref:Uncharacterized protein n=1 Tax=Pleuronectes platessa TaxID=8262 RepID=A0A9N7V3F8_PLEPL|nr:unnamed protein product [Pleuronectes platessa]